MENKNQKEPTDWERTSANDVKDKRLISKPYKLLI